MVAQLLSEAKQRLAPSGHILMCFSNKDRGSLNAIERMFEQYEYRSELFRKEYLPKVRPFPKVCELFQRIHHDKKRIVLASSGKKADTEYYVDLLKIGEFIDGCVSGDDADRSKPAPDIFVRTAELLEVGPNECWVIEDSKPGIAAALAAGMKVIAITNTHPAEELAQATHVARTYAEIEQLLE